MLRPEPSSSSPAVWFAYRHALSISLLLLVHLFILALILLPPDLEGRHYLLLWLSLLDLEVVSSSIRYRTYYLERSARHRAFAAFWLDVTTCGLVAYSGNTEQAWMAATVVALSVAEVWHGMQCARKLKALGGPGKAGGGLESNEAAAASEAVHLTRPHVDGIDRSL